MTRDDRFLVLGSNSFSGSHFVAHVLAEGAEVAGISRSPEAPDVFLAYKWAPHKRFRFHQADLNAALDEILRIVDAFQPDYIVNFAAQGMVGQSWEHPEHWFLTNVVSMVKLHDQLRTRSFLKTYVQVSTPEVYGATAGWVKEDAPYHPSTPYAVSKAACDMSLQAFHRAYGFPVVFSRSANVCGPGQQLFRILPKTIFSIARGRKLPLEGGGDSVRSFIDIRDVCDATARMARSGRPGEVYHVSVARHIAIRDLVALVCQAMGRCLEDLVEVSPGRRGQDAAYRLDCSKAESELAWKPRIPLETTIADTIRWVEENMDILQTLPDRYVHRP